MIILLVAASLGMSAPQPQFDAQHALACYGGTAFLVGEERDGRNLSRLAPEEDLATVLEEADYWALRTEPAARPDLSAADQRQLALANSALETARLLLSEGPSAVQGYVRTGLAQCRADRAVIDEAAQPVTETE